MLDMIEKWYWKDSGCTLSYSGFWGIQKMQKEMKAEFWTKI